MNERFRPVIEACVSGSLPPNVALMQMMMAAETEDEVARALSSAIGDEEGGPAHLRQAQNLLRTHPNAFTLVKQVACEAAQSRSSEQAVQFWRALYDRWARETAEAAVALYTFGSPELLARATEEVVSALHDWQVISPHSRVLEIGCGQGRFLRAIAPMVASITGLDISKQMLAHAAQGTAGLNVRLLQGSGRDLAMLADASFELVLAVDSFPFIIDAGLGEQMLAETARVLAPGGHVAIFNFSYRGDIAGDAEEVGTLFKGHRFSIEHYGTRDFQFWDAPAFVGRKHW